MGVQISRLTVKASSKTAADDILFFFHYFSEKIRLDISCELSARQTVHMKCQALFPLKNTFKKNFNMSSAAAVTEDLRFKHSTVQLQHFSRNAHGCSC